MEVINVDINGNEIPDLSKVNLPEEINNFVLNLYIQSAKQKEMRKAI